MQTYSDFQKKAELGGAGEYFQRREEELAKSEMEGYRDGTAVKYPGSWTQTPGTDYWNLDESKVPSGYHQAFWQKMDSINRKYNGNLYRSYRQKENDPTGQGVTTGSMGYKMLAQEPEPIMLPPLTVTAHDYTAEMNKDWDEHMNRIKNSGPMDNIPSTQDYMTSRWGKDWMTNPYPQQQSGTTQGPTVPMVKNQSYKEFCKKALFEDTIGPTDSILSLHTDSIFDAPRHTDSILEPKLDTTLNLGNACRPGGCTTAPDTGWVSRNPELAAGIGTLLLGGGGVLLYKLMQDAKKQKQKPLAKSGSARSDFWYSALGAPFYGAASGAAAAASLEREKKDMEEAFKGTGKKPGSMADPATEIEEEVWDRHPESALIPGIGVNRTDRRIKRQLLNDKGKTPHFWSQRIGNLAPLLILAGLAGVGGYMYADKKDLRMANGNSAKGIAAAAGAGAGFLGGALSLEAGGGLAALLTPTRTKEQQKAYANSPTTKEWLIPGLSSYNEYKTYGRMFADSDERAAKRRKEGKA